MLSFLLETFKVRGQTLVDLLLLNFNSNACNFLAGRHWPMFQVRAVLSAPDVQTRNDLIAAHLKHLESDLVRTQTAVASLRNLLEYPTRLWISGAARWSGCPRQR